MLKILEKFISLESSYISSLVRRICRYRLIPRSKNSCVFNNTVVYLSDIAQVILVIKNTTPEMVRN